MKGLNRLDIINKSKKNGRIYRLLSGGEVVGQEVDQNNELFYVIKKDGQFSVQSARSADIIPEIHPTNNSSTTVVRVGQSK